MTLAVQAATKGRAAKIEVLDARRVADFIVDHFEDRKFTLLGISHLRNVLASQVRMLRVDATPGCELMTSYRGQADESTLRTDQIFGIWL